MNLPATALDGLVERRATWSIHVRDPDGLLAREILVADAVRRGSPRPLFDVAWVRAGVPPHALVCRTPPAPGGALAALHDRLREEAAASVG